MIATRQVRAAAFFFLYRISYFAGGLNCYTKDHLSATIEMLLRLKTKV